MFTVKDKLEKNIFEIRSYPFTCAGASFGLAAVPIRHAPLARVGKWGTADLFIESGKGAVPALSNNNQMMQLVPVHHGEIIPFAIQTTATELRIRTEYGDIRCCYADPSLLLVQGENGLGIRLETSMGLHGVIRPKGSTGWEVTAGYVSCFVFNAVHGVMKMKADWELERISTPCVRGEVVPEEDGTFLLSVEESEDLGKVRDSYPSYEEAHRASEESWNTFLQTLPLDACPEKDRALEAAYWLWAAVERPSCRLKRQYMHSTFLKAPETWKTCLISAALTGNLPLAMDLLLGQLDQQAENGQIPAYFDDTNCDCLNAGLPLQGWALEQLMKSHDLKTEIPEAQLQTLYDGYSKWADWFFRYRDDDGDGIPQTEGPVECGCEDSPIFEKAQVVELPEVSADLAVLMEVLGRLASLCNLPEESEAWFEKSRNLIDSMIRKFWNGKQFVALDHSSGTPIVCDSIQNYRPIILGKRLPKEILDRMAEELSMGNGFLTPCGVTSLRMTSTEFSRLGAYTGSILAADNVLVATGLLEAGKTELAAETAAAFCDGILHPESAGYPAGRGFDSADTAAAYFLLRRLAASME